MTAMPTSNTPSETTATTTTTARRRSSTKTTPRRRLHRRRRGRTVIVPSSSYRHHHHRPVPLLPVVLSLVVAAMMIACSPTLTLASAAASAGDEAGGEEVKVPPHLRDHTRGRRLCDLERYGGCAVHPAELLGAEVQTSLKKFRTRLEDLRPAAADADAGPASSSATGNAGGEGGGGDEEDGDEVEYQYHFDVLDDSATLTLIGYKGGDPRNQINQDRAVVVSPLWTTSELSPDNNDSGFVGGGGHDHEDNFLVGVFDGHGSGGEVVSHHAAVHLPRKLSSRLSSIVKKSTGSTSATTGRETMNESEDEEENVEGDDDVRGSIVKAIHDTFLELDSSSPPTSSEMGGATASVVLHHAGKLYVANAGDSRTFVATYDRTTSTTKVVYVTREDKAHLPKERERIEKLGGVVYHTGPTSRVGVPNPDKNVNGGRPLYGLAMSRSIGDWAVGRLGVIPDPIIEVLDVRVDVLGVAPPGDGERQCSAASSSPNGSGDAADSEEVCEEEGDAADGDDVEVFVVSATDGMLDYINPENIARHVASSLYGTGDHMEDHGGSNEGDDESSKKQPRRSRPKHPLLACEELIIAAAQGWHRENKGQYRDDIAIAVKRVPLPRSH